MKRIVPLGAALVLAFGACAVRANADAAVKVIVTRTTGHAKLVVIADADVASIVAAKSADAAANELLEREALRAIAAKLGDLTTSTTIGARVVYEETVAISTAYSTMGPNELQHYADVEIATADAVSDRDKWREAAASPNGTLPSWIGFTVVGALPPR